MHHISVNFFLEKYQHFQDHCTYMENWDEKVLFFNLSQLASTSASLTLRKEIGTVYKT